MGLSFIEAFKSPDTPEDILPVIQELSRNEFVGILPYMGVEGGGLDYLVEGDLPSVDFRGFNERGEDSHGIINPQYDRLKILSGDIDIDPVLLKRKPNTKADQIRMKVRAMGLKFVDTFINGDESVDVRQFDGLKTRIPATSSQAVNFGGAITLTKMLELRDAVDNIGEPFYWVMNKALRRRLTVGSASTEVGGYITYQQDEFGREQTLFAGGQILVTDTNNLNAQIQPFNEAGSTSSIYCVAMGDMATTPIQDSASEGSMSIRIREFGETPEGPDRTRIEWECGLAILNGRTAARGYAVTDAVMTR